MREEGKGPGGERKQGEKENRAWWVEEDRKWLSGGGNEEERVGMGVVEEGKRKLSRKGPGEVRKTWRVVVGKGGLVGGDGMGWGVVNVVGTAKRRRKGPGECGMT